MLPTIKLVLIFLAGGLTIFSLLAVNKKKKHFQIYPDSIKKDFYKSVRTMTIMNVIGAVFILTSCLFLNTHLFFVFLFLSAFLSIGALYALYDEFDEFNDDEEM